MRRFKRPITGALILLTGLLAGAATPSVFVLPGDVDWQSVLSGPPAVDSPEHRAEVADLLHLQVRRTAQQINRCRSERVLQPSVFDDVLGDDFNGRRAPQIIALLEQAAVDTDNINCLAKDHWGRPRPNQEDPRIRPCVPLDSSPSYPSGNAACARMWGRVLAELFPQKRQALLDLANGVGFDRALAGAHYPSDVAAGQKLGDAVANKLLDNTEFRAALDHARAETASVQK